MEIKYNIWHIDGYVGWDEVLTVQPLDRFLLA